MPYAKFFMLIREFTKFTRNPQGKICKQLFMVCFLCLSPLHCLLLWWLLSVAVLLQWREKTPQKQWLPNFHIQQRKASGLKFTVSDVFSGITKTQQAWTGMIGKGRGERRQLGLSQWSKVYFDNNNVGDGLNRGKRHHDVWFYFLFQLSVKCVFWWVYETVKVETKRQG